MATEDLVPTYLQEIFNRAIPDQLTDNEPLQAFTAPLDPMILSETVTATQKTPTSKWGSMVYGADSWG